VKLDRLEHIMGMPIGIDVRDADVDPAALDRAFDWLRWVDATFSTYKPESEISRLNRGEISHDELHPEVQAVLDRCEQLQRQTNGYFDIRTESLPPEGGAGSGIDPSGLVKGWAVERAGEILDEAGARNYSINAGGDVRVRGRPSDEEPYWRVGIQHPLIRDKIAAVVAGFSVGVATSGAYERGEHIVDPHTGRPPSDVLSVTIVGPDLGTADAYATAAFAMGADGPAWTARLFGYEAMTITADERVLYTRAFPSVNS
jgi:thiamine biosynthesis lipoprotein